MTSYLYRKFDIQKWRHSNNAMMLSESCEIENFKSSIFLSFAHNGLFLLSSIKSSSWLIIFFQVVFTLKYLSLHFIVKEKRKTIQKLSDSSMWHSKTPSMKRSFVNSIRMQMVNNPRFNLIFIILDSNLKALHKSVSLFLDDWIIDEGFWIFQLY